MPNLLTSAKLALPPNLVALDLETKCKDPTCSHPDSASCYAAGHALHPKTAKISCIGIWSPTISKVFRGENAAAEAGAYIKKHKLAIVGHNLTFDLKILYFNNVDLRPYWEHDTQVMAHTLTEKIPDSWLERYEVRRKEENEKLPRGFSHRTSSLHSLKTLAPFFLSVKPFWEDPTNHDSDEYVLKDCEYTYKLVEVLGKRLDMLNQLSFYQNKALPWNKFLLNVSLAGIGIDLNEVAKVERELINQEQELRYKLDKHWEKANQRYFELERMKIRARYQDMSLRATKRLKDTKKTNQTLARYEDKYQLAIKKLPNRINYDSPKQMLWLLKEYLMLPVVNFDGDESTGVEVLERLAAGGRQDVKDFLEWRGVHKLLSSYIPNYKALEMLGRIHANFNGTGTRTGRLSSSNPNLQNQPPELYRVFKPRPGCNYVGFDLESIEGKLIAAYSQDPKLCEIMLSGASLHDWNASKVFFDLDCGLSEVKTKYPKHRQACKRVGFALFYGAGANRIKASFASDGFHLTDEEAKAKHKSFKNGYKDAIQYHRDVTSAFEQGEVIENSLGRPIAISDPDQAYMKGFNTLIQSSASDLCLEAAYRAQLEYDKLGLDAKVIMLVHDFLMVECKQEISEKVAEILKHEMTKYKFDTPYGEIKLTVSGFVGQKWEK